jgi:hypothetical protein
MDSAHSEADGPDPRDNELVASITPDIMACLAERRFFGSEQESVKACILRGFAHDNEFSSESDHPLSF